MGVLLPEALYGLVFYGSAAAVAVNLALLALLYRDDVAPRPERRVADVLKGLAEVRRDTWFLALLVAYSGLWFMYAQYQFFTGLYMADFLRVPAWFTVPLVQTVNPAVIILAGPFVGRALSRFPSLPVVIAGIALYVAGIMVLGAFALPWLFFTGLVVASVGEVVAHPSFLSYASKVAPPDRVAVYLGYAFIPVGAGYVLGLAMGGFLYGQYATSLHQPALYWGATAAVGVLGIAGLLGVNNRMAGRAPAAQALGRRSARVVEHRAAPLAVLVLVPLMLLAGAAPGSQPFLREGALPPAGPLAASMALVELEPLEGSTTEGQASEVEVIVEDARAVNVSFTMRWRDEAPATGPLPGASNEPDAFQLAVLTPDGRSLEGDEAENPPGGEGVARLAVPSLPGRAADGAYKVAVRLQRAGDTVIGPGLAATRDGANAWVLQPSYEAPRDGVG